CAIQGLKGFDDGIGGSPVRIMSSDNAHHAPNFTGKCGAGSWTELDVIEIGRAGGSSPAAKKTIHRQLRQLTRIESKLQPRPIVVAQEGFRGAVHWILQFMNIQEGAARAAEGLHVIRFYPGSELVIELWFYGDSHGPTDIAA